VQRIIIALASGPSYDRVPIPPKPLQTHKTDIAARQVVVDSFIQKYTRGFSGPILSTRFDGPNHFDQCVLITWAMGSLGSHLVAYFAALPSDKKVICLNRYSSTECSIRQRQALESKGLSLNSEALSKLKVFETDTAKPMLGLSSIGYAKLVNSITHIVHNAWPMSITRSINGFESQFRVMQNLIELARESSCRHRQQGPKVGFQFISSIATVGYYPLMSAKARVPEERMMVDSVLPTGCGDAKLVCERMLDETLHKNPDQFRPMAVRIGQIAGSKISRSWNPVEHLAFIIKSSYPIYHIENPIRQPWGEMVGVLASALDVRRANIIPFNEWIGRVRQFPGSADFHNPAAKLIDFLDTQFVRMSCGGLILDTAKSTEHSETLRNQRPVSCELVRKYIRAWKDIRFLHE
jgi:nucleoside-diphosphate-sugar epimerase